MKDRLYVENIWNSILLIEKYTKGITLKDFKEDSEKIDAVSKRLEEIGENSNKISDKLKKIKFNLLKNE